MRIIFCAIMLSLWRQALARLAEEIAKSGIPEGSRKINGKYIHTHLVTRLKGTIMLFLYPNKSTTSIWFACVLMDNCSLLWNKTYITAISSSFLSLLMQLHCCCLHSCTRTIEWANKGCWCSTIKGGFCILGRHGWGKYICKNILPNIENMGWNFVPWWLCFACINDYLYRALKTLVYTHSCLRIMLWT